MDDDREALEKRHAEQTAELYAAIGKFAVEFEMVCSSMRAIIMTTLWKEGLHNDNAMEILLADHTAEPLRSLAHSLASETQKLSEKDGRILAAIMNQVQELTKSRNDVLHAEWLIGWVATEVGPVLAPGRRLKRDKMGLATQWPNF